MPSVVALARGPLAHELRLAGLHVEEFEAARDVEARLGKLIESKEARVVIVQEDFRRDFSEWFTERLKRHKDLPLVVYCPSFENEESDVDAYITAVLKPAIGYEIRLE